MISTTHCPILSGAVPNDGHRLPAVHRDPFDRLLVAQAMHLGAALISADEQLHAYPLQIVW